MTRFGVMKHLKVLEEAGLVVTRRSGREARDAGRPRRPRRRPAVPAVASWLARSVAGMKWPVRAAAALQLLRGDHEVHEPHATLGRAQDVAVGAAQRRARHDGRAARRRHRVPDRAQPRDRGRRR